MNLTRQQSRRVEKWRNNQKIDILWKRFLRLRVFGRGISCSSDNETLCESEREKQFVLVLLKESVLFLEVIFVPFEFFYCHQPFQKSENDANSQQQQRQHHPQQQQQQFVDGLLWFRRQTVDGIQVCRQEEEEVTSQSEKTSHGDVAK